MYFSFADWAPLKCALSYILHKALGLGGISELSDPSKEGLQNIFFSGVAS